MLRFYPRGCERICTISLTDNAFASGAVPGLSALCRSSVKSPCICPPRSTALSQRQSLETAGFEVAKHAQSKPTAHSITEAIRSKVLAVAGLMSRPFVSATERRMALAHVPAVALHLVVSVRTLTRSVNLQKSHAKQHTESRFLRALHPQI